LPPGAAMDAGLLGPERARGGAGSGREARRGEALSVLAWPVSCPVPPGS
jgi:hypothetical protein